MPRAKRKSAVASAKSEVEADAAASSHHQHHQQDGPSSSTLDASASNLAGYYVPAVAPSDVSTSGDEDDEAWITNDGGEADTTSNVQPPAPAQSDDDDDDEGPSGAASSGAKNKKEATCRWNDCGQVFADMIKFIDHLHNTHVGNSRNKYACEWTGCSRRGKPQTSRFALLSHLRSHTGEKPFTCPRPDCDKSFTRSDALSKHMRVQHDIMPAPARGGRLSAAALAERAAAEKGGQEGGRSGGAGTRSSARRSALAAAVNNNDAASLDEELLGLAEGGAAAVSTAAQIAANADALPGDPLHWTYEAMFPHEEGNDAQQQTQPQQQQATTQSFASGVGGGGSSMISQPQQTATGSSRFTDEELSIERFSSIRKRIPLSWVDGTLEDWNPTAGALAAAVDTSNKPELQYSRDDQAAEAEAVLVLEKARRQWVQEMAKRQEAESKEPGGSGGAFVGNWHAMQGGGRSGAVDTPADGAAAARPSSSAGGAFYDSDSDMSDIEPTGGEEAAPVPAPAPAPAAPSPFAAPAARETAAASAGTPTSGRPKRQTRPPASRHLDDGSDAGGEADASSSKMQVDDNGPAAGASSKAFDEESVLSSPPSSPPPSAPSAMDLSAMTTPVPQPPPVAAVASRRPAAAAPPPARGGDSSSNRTLLSTLIRAHLVESAKLSIAQAENRRLVADLEGCLVELRDLMWEKKRVLEAVLEMELGADVKAIFDPAGDGEDGQQHHHHNGQEDETMREVDGIPHHDGMAAFGVGDGASAVAAAAAALQHHAQQQEQRAYG